MTAAYFEDHPTDPDKVILRKPRLDQGPDYERGFIDGMMYQTQTTVNRAVDAMSKRTWVGLMDEEIDQLAINAGIVTWVKRVYDDTDKKFYGLPLGEGMLGDEICLKQFASLISNKLKEKNT
jgi:hypothetical protein